MKVVMAVMRDMQALKVQHCMGRQHIVVLVIEIHATDS
jgi:hypothetical protein